MNETAPRTPEGDPLDPESAALAAALLEIGRHVDGETLRAPRWFALARSAALLAQQPGIAALLGVEATDVLGADAAHLTPIELEELPAMHDPLESLAAVSWPDIAVGGALALDLPAASWRSRIDDSDAQARRTAEALDGGTLRVLVAATQDGVTYSALRRAGDRPSGPARYVMGPALLPELTQALAESLHG
ncbi:PPA1309 family protein [Brachybacterium hainanense]|uniref:PPA1309 family protein n=1 Tax=Brachybacterium hainanense TaxID=1541174 RepID=A0ABV6R8Z1_9MICO